MLIIHNIYAIFVQDGYLEVIMGSNKIRFNCMMKSSTREKLHHIATDNNRSDSNMVEYLIDSYGKKQENTNDESEEKSENEVRK